VYFTHSFRLTPLLCCVTVSVSLLCYVVSQFPSHFSVMLLCDWFGHSYVTVPCNGVNSVMVPTITSR